MIVTSVLMLGDLIWAIITIRRPFYSGLLRPIVVGCFMHSVRINAINLFKDLKDSFVVLLSIFIFIFCYANIGNFIFRTTIEGYIYFDDLQDSYYNMFVLMTTANFPDVMLPAYEDNYWVVFYFISFLIIGLFFLMSLLLANIFNKFRERLETEGLQYLRKQSLYLNQYIDRFDENEKGYLTADETQKFFKELLNLKITECRRDYDTFKHLLKEMQIKNSEKVSKEEIFEFFMAHDGYQRFKTIF